ncbi:hypothetical protein GL218_09056 [Daldinia childiae]|uniref:uncharacterized protein n=1 Tax=Daldinia childiae TaxID=326645 RepID=UPI00144501A8|nr:uncharacterized protein GL218_09056 [Daldinia childiae]KAF3066522.1 hypothetical protein GL218_09056 [Daldinia childiae]
MSGMPTGSEFIKYCTCEPCSYGLKGQCEVSRELYEHTQVVAAILANGSQRMIAIGYAVRRDRYHVTCHASLLCYWSPVIKNAMERESNPVSAFWIAFGENGRRAIMIWKQIIQWCYVGRLMDPSDSSDATIGHNSDIEALWHAALTLEMHELANYCLRLIVIKYTWGLSVRSDTRVEFNPRDCPFDAAGLYEVFLQNQRGRFHRKLLLFMEDLLTARGPLTPGAMEHVSPAAMQKWTDLMYRHPRFSQWINRFGGLEHNNQNAILPTHFNQWAKYRVPVTPKVPANVQDWVDENKEALRKEGHSVTLMARWRREGEGENASDHWQFHRVHPRTPIGQE